MFEPKTLKQAYKFAYLQGNTISYKQSHHNQIKHSIQTTLQTTQTKHHFF